jgi:hypothetical protein
LRRLILKYTWMRPSNIDETSFQVFHAQQTHIIGFYLPAGDSMTSEQAIEQIALSGGAVAGQDRSGLYRVVRLDVPSESPAHAFDAGSIMSIERMPLPYGVPFYRWSVDGVRNWSVQRAADLAGIVTETRRRFLEAETRQASADVPNVAQAHLTSATTSRKAFFHFISNATDEAVRLATFYGLGRALYRVTVRGALFEIGIAETVRLTYPRWNLTQGRNFIVVGVSDSMTDTEIEVYG